MKGFFVCCLFVFLTFVSRWPRCTSPGITCLSLCLCVHARVQMSLWVHVPWGPLLSSCPSSCPPGFLRQALPDQDPWWVRLDGQEAPGSTCLCLPKHIPLLHAVELRLLLVRETLSSVLSALWIPCHSWKPVCLKTTVEDEQSKFSRWPFDPCPVA